MIQIPIEIGDIILAGRFKNKKITVKEIGYDEFGSPTINGRSILKIRIPKLYQKQENEMKTNKNNINENASKYFQYIKMADLYGWKNVFDVLQKAGYDTMSYRVSSIPTEGSATIDLKTTTPTMKNDIVVEKVYEDTKDGGIVVKTNKAFLKFWNNNMKESKQLKESLSPNKLKVIDRNIQWGNEKQMPMSQGHAINTVIKQYNIPAIKWGYVKTGKFIGVETEKQKIFWEDRGSDLKFLGILNKDGSVAESKQINENDTSKVKIKKKDGRWNAELDGKCLSATGFETKEQAEHFAMMKGYDFTGNDASESYEIDSPNPPKMEPIKYKKPIEVEVGKEKEIKLENKIRKIIKEIRGKKKVNLKEEIEIDDADVEEYAQLIDKIDKMKAELSKLTKRFDELDDKFKKMLDVLEMELGESKENFIRYKNILITIKRKGYERTNYKYKEAFDELYGKVNAKMQKMIDETLEANKTITKISSSLSVQYESDNFISNIFNKVKNWFVSFIVKLRTTNKQIKSDLTALEQMI